MARELTTRYVDGDAQSEVGPRSGKIGAAAARFAEDPGSDVDDQAGVFRGGNELIGRNEAVPRAVPPEQRLESSDLTGLARHDRLILEVQLISTQRPPEVAFESVLLRYPCLHLFVEELDSISAILFCSIHRNVGVRDQYV